MIHKHQHIANMVEIFSLHGVEDVIISPGSRNAPLTNAFYKKFGDACTSIVDERSAAYMALGKSLKTKKPTILVCTSGTAALNYAPALAEAYFQGVPLLALTADRPPELIGQQDNQTIYQDNLYQPNIKASFTFLADILSTNSLKETEKVVNEAYHLSLQDFPGPVHINIPLREPLYEPLPRAQNRICFHQPEKKRKKEIPQEFIEKWEQAESIFIVCGQHSPVKELKDSIARVSKDKRVVVVAEAIANIEEGVTIHSPDVAINFKDKNLGKLAPLFVLYFGGHVVSKKLKNFLKQQSQAAFYFIEDSGREIDTFQLLHKSIKNKPSFVFNNLPLQEGMPNEFKTYWENKNQHCIARADEYLKTAPYSDLMAFKNIASLLPQDSIVFAGNSSVVRYLHYFNQGGRTFYSNRGTSGIDGILSTATGLATKTNKQVYAILGDLSFMYDSNALWNRDFPRNLRIIVINNKGGGIFHLIQGPSKEASFDPFFNAHHPVNIEKLAEAFGFDYIHCNKLEMLGASIQQISEKNASQVILEIETNNNGKPDITHDFFNYIKN